MSRRDTDPRVETSESRSSWRVNLLSAAFVLMALEGAVLAICFVYALLFVVPELLELGWALKDEMRLLAETLAEVER